MVHTSGKRLRVLFSTVQPRSCTRNAFMRGCASTWCSQRSLWSSLAYEICLPPWPCCLLHVHVALRYCIFCSPCGAYARKGTEKIQELEELMHASGHDCFIPQLDTSTASVICLTLQSFYVSISCKAVSEMTLMFPASEISSTARTMRVLAKEKARHLPGVVQLSLLWMAQKHLMPT